LQRLLQNAQTRARMAQRGSELVDGRGAERVVRKLRDGDISLRPACPADCHLIWEWANEPAVRTASFSPATIPWEVHQEWFEARLNDPNCALFVALNKAGVPIGQVRCEVKGDGVAVLSISVDTRFRGKGYGTQLIRKATQELFGRGNVDTIQAFIRHGNAASQKAFEQAGFRKVQDTNIRGYTASLLELRK
jgi:UDP-2,4-diacetamido-2,4,6-trideoxy-beta-L-altropyranose hydrolase